MNTIFKEQIGIPQATKNEITKIYDLGQVKAQRILESLVTSGVEPPTLSQLNNFLAQYRKKKHGKNQISLGELRKWCEDRSTIPENLDCPFVPAFNLSHDEETNHSVVRVFVTTRRLLVNTAFVNHLATDGTYKLIWQGYPVLMLGTTDQNRSYHPFGIAITLKEERDDYAFIFNSLKKP